MILSALFCCKEGRKYKHKRRKKEGKRKKRGRI
jgi:hypothetical protein